VLPSDPKVILGVIPSDPRSAPKWSQECSQVIPGVLPSDPKVIPGVLPSDLRSALSQVHTSATSTLDGVWIQLNYLAWEGRPFIG